MCEGPGPIRALRHRESHTCARPNEPEEPLLHPEAGPVRSGPASAGAVALGVFLKMAHCCSREDMDVEVVRVVVAAAVERVVDVGL